MYLRLIFIILEKYIAYWKVLYVLIHTSILDLVGHMEHVTVVLCIIPAVMRRGIYILCILNIRTGPEIAVCHLPLSTYMYNTTKVTSLFDVSMSDIYIRENGRQQHTDHASDTGFTCQLSCTNCSPFIVFQSIK